MLRFDKATAKLSNLNTRLEKHGRKETKPAADLKLEMQIPAAQLEQISPGLALSLYRAENEEGHQADMMAGTGQLTTLRHPKARPWASTEDLPGYKAALRFGSIDPVEIPVEMATLKSITCEPKTGGTVELSFTLSANPTGDDVGALYEGMGAEFELDLTPPGIELLEKLRTQPKASDDAGPGEGGEGEGGDDDTPPSTGRAFPDAIDARGDSPPSARRKAKAPAGLH